MPKVERRHTGSFDVRRDDDGEVFTIWEITTFREQHTQWGAEMVPGALVDIVCSDGRSVFATDEGTFFFKDETDRPMRRIDHPKA
jgi:hypothetical protein